MGSSENGRMRKIIPYRLAKPNPYVRPSAVHQSSIPRNPCIVACQNRDPESLKHEETGPKSSSLDMTPHSGSDSATPKIPSPQKKKRLVQQHDARNTRANAPGPKGRATVAKKSTAKPRKPRSKRASPSKTATEPRAPTGPAPFSHREREQKAAGPRLGRAPALSQVLGGADNAHAQHQALIALASNAQILVVADSKELRLNLVAVGDLELGASGRVAVGRGGNSSR